MELNVRPLHLRRSQAVSVSADAWSHTVKTMRMSRVRFRTTEAKLQNPQAAVGQLSGKRVLVATAHSRHVHVTKGDRRHKPSQLDRRSKADHAIGETSG